MKTRKKDSLCRGGINGVRLDSLLNLCEGKEVF